MASQTSQNRLTGFRRVATGAVASGALAAGLLMGFGSATANADILDDIAAQYDNGAGAGKVSNYIHEAMTLRAQGYQPSKSNVRKLEEAWEDRPNQVPLTEALQATIAYQRKIQAQQAAAGDPGTPLVIGRQPLPPGVPADPGNPDNTGIGLIPGGGSTINQPVG